MVAIDFSLVHLLGLCHCVGVPPIYQFDSDCKIASQLVASGLVAEWELQMPFCDHLSHFRRHNPCPN